MRRVWTLWIAVSLVTACGEPDGSKAATPDETQMGPCAPLVDRAGCLGDDACDWVDAQCVDVGQGAAPALSPVYTIEDEATVSLRLIEPDSDVSRATLTFGDEVSFGARVRIGSDGAVRVDTSAPRCLADGCDWARLVLDGSLADGVLQLDVRDEAGDAISGWEQLRFAPHDGVKPVNYPQFDIEYDPHPVAGLFVGDAFIDSAAGRVSGPCGLQLTSTGEFLVLQCGSLPMQAPMNAEWDEASGLVNAPFGPDGALTLLAVVEPDASLEGVVVTDFESESLVHPDDASYEQLVGTLELFEEGAR